jgi:histidinol dehydrogenase
VPKSFIAAVKRIRRNVSDYHKRQLPREWTFDAGMGSTLGELIRPVASVGAYVPGGTAPLVSTLLMTVVPARTAGVRRIAVATPPDKEGSVNPHILATADLLGVEEVYKMGGAQAIAALAFGTATVGRVDKIVGPGNIYVTEAKRQVFGDVDIDCIAGPSEILVLADGTANARYIAADILSQAEHGTGEEISVLVTDSDEVARDVADEVGRQLKQLGRKDMMARVIRKGTFAVVTKDLNEAVRFTNGFAAEHLEVMVKKPKALVKRITNAGAIFIGPYSPVPVGDFVAGPSHVLPTNGAAKSFSGLSVLDFVKRIGTVNYTRKKLDSVSRDLRTIAMVEGLDAHARTAEIRK